MARAAKTIKTTKPVAPVRKARPAVAGGQLKKAPMPAAGKRAVAAPTKSQKQAPAKTHVAARATATKVPKLAARVPAAPLAPKLSKEELRVQVEKLEQLVVTLRTKGREANKAAKATAAHILALEAQVTDLEKKVAAAVPAAPQTPEAVKAPRAKRQGGKSDAADKGALIVEAPKPATPGKGADMAAEDLPASGDRA